MLNKPERIPHIQMSRNLQTTITLFRKKYLITYLHVFKITSFNRQNVIFKHVHSKSAMQIHVTLFPFLAMIISFETFQWQGIVIACLCLILPLQPGFFTILYQEWILFYSRDNIDRQHIDRRTITTAVRTWLNYTTYMSVDRHLLDPSWATTHPCDQSVLGVSTWLHYI